MIKTFTELEMSPGMESLLPKLAKIYGKSQEMSFIKTFDQEIYEVKSRTRHYQDKVLLER